MSSNFPPSTLQKRGTPQNALVGTHASLTSGAGPDLPADVVRAAFEYAQERQVPLAAFLGDECATLQMHPELEVCLVSFICAKNSCTVRPASVTCPKLPETLEASFPKLSAMKWVCADAAQ